MAHPALPTGISQRIEAIFQPHYPAPLSPLFRHPIRLGLGWLVGSVVLHIIISLIFGGFSGTPDVIDFVEDPVYLPVLGIFGLAFVYYFGLPKRLGRTFAALDSRGLFPNGLKIDPKLEKRLESPILRWLPLVSCGIVLVAWILLIVFDPEGYKFWFELNIVSFVVLTITYAVAWYPVIGLILDVIIAIYVTNTLLKDTRIKVLPLHPDGSGGFSPLSQYSLWLSYYALVYALFLISAVWRSFSNDVLSTDYGLLIQVVLYVVAVPVLFYLPLHSTHKAMLAYRDELIREASDEYAKLHRNLSQKLPSDVKELNTSLDYVDSLSRLQKQYLAYPVWPFTMRVRMRVLVNASIPVIPTVIGLLVEILK